MSTLESLEQKRAHLIAERGKLDAQIRALDMVIAMDDGYTDEYEDTTGDEKAYEKNAGISKADTQKKAVRHGVELQYTEQELEEKKATKIERDLGFTSKVVSTKHETDTNGRNVEIIEEYIG